MDILESKAATFLGGVLTSILTFIIWILKVGSNATIAKSVSEQNSERIKTLELKDAKNTEILKNMGEDVKEIKQFMTDGGVFNLKRDLISEISNLIKKGR